MKTLEELTAERPATTVIDVPEWGGPVKIKRLTTRDQLDIARDLQTAKDDATESGDLLARVLRMTVIDDSGELVFGSEAGAAYLERETLATVSRAGIAALRFMRLIESDDLDEKKTV